MNRSDTPSASDTFLRLAQQSNTRSKRNLTVTALKFALLDGEHERAYELLKLLKRPLSPKDAEAVCQAAMNSPQNLMNAVLDRCVPVPEFLPYTDLLYKTISGDHADLLDCFLNHGADPNRMDACSSIAPLHYAFSHNAAACMERLLEEPSLLRPDLSEYILLDWGRLNLHNDETDLAFRRCCRLMCSALGIPVDPDDPFPVPPQLQLKHALHHKNARLAAQLCRVRPLTEQELSDAQDFFRGKTSWSGSPLWDPALSPQDYAQFLDAFLQRYPHLLHESVFRTEVACTALHLPEVDAPVLMRWVDRMESGPVLLPRLPLQINDHNDHLVHLAADMEFLIEWSSDADEAFITRWSKLLSPRLFPVIDADHSFCLAMSDEAYRILLPWLRVVNRPDGRLSAVARQVLLFAPADLLADLMQPGMLLAEEPHPAMLKACAQLPPARRNALLPFLVKEASYDL